MFLRSTRTASPESDFSEYRTALDALASVHQLDLADTIIDDAPRPKVVATMEAHIGVIGLVGGLGRGFVQEAKVFLGGLQPDTGVDPSLAFSVSEPEGVPSAVQSTEPRYVRRSIAGIVRYCHQERLGSLIVRMPWQSVR